MKYVKYGFCVVFMLIIFFFFVTTINNENTVSYVEKRNLQTFPEFSVEALMDGTYLEDLTIAFSDQLEFRDHLIKGYFIFQFQRYNGDVVIGENNELYAAVQSMSDIATEQSYVASSVSYINQIGPNVGAEFIFMSIPRKDAVETENLPSSYISSEECYKACIETVRANLDPSLTLIDAYEVFQEDDHAHRYYYMTDHHITPDAAELLYLELLEVIDDDRIPVYDLSNYEVGETIINGSFNNQIGQSVKSTPEELYILPEFDLEYVRYEDDTESDMTVWAKANTYEDAYMEGDHAYTVIDTGRPELPNILYVGSSFTNIMEAISIPSFNKTVSIDYRHNTSGNSIQYYVEKHDIDYVVFMPSQSTNAFSSITKHLGL